MAFDKYVQGSVTPPAIEQVYSQLKEHVDSTRGLMAALGTFWSESYGDLARSQTAYETMVHAVTGCVLPLSDAYRSLLDATLEASIQSIPVVRDKQIELVVFSETEADHVTGPRESYVFHGTPILDVDYFMANLLGDLIILEKGRHFDVDWDTGDITFYVDIFADPAIIQDAYGEFDKIQSPKRSIMLWGVNVVQQSFSIWERYGQLVYRRAADSRRYKDLITALMYYYSNMKSLENIENVMNIVYGVPYALHDGEKVLYIYPVGKDFRPASVSDEDDANYQCIVTQDGSRTRRYYCYGMADITVKAGDVLKKYQLMGRLHEVYDYKQVESDPERFIPATAHPEDMSKSEQIDYVYAHWADSDKSPAEEDSIILTPDLRAEVIRHVLKYNSLFIKHKIDFQSIDTYKNQVEQLKRILRSGLPVYLNPMLETIFQARFVDYIPTEEELKERMAVARENMENSVDAYERALWEQELDKWAGWTADNAAVIDGGIKAVNDMALDDRFSADTLYDGFEIYNGGTCIDHDSKMTGRLLKYGGRLDYNGMYAHHGAYTAGKVRYDGLMKYGNCFGALHDNERDDMRIFNMRNDVTDVFPYSKDDESLLRQVYYDSSFEHDGSAAYGLTSMFWDLRVKCDVKPYSDVFFTPTDSFEFSAEGAERAMFMLDDIADGIDDRFEIFLKPRLAETVASGDSTDLLELRAG